MNKLRATCLQTRGLVSRIADECGVTQGAVSQWLKSQVPAKRVLVVEKLTGVPREEIRPDVFKISTPVVSSPTGKAQPPTPPAADPHRSRHA